MSVPNFNSLKFKHLGEETSFKMLSETLKILIGDCEP